MSERRIKVPDVGEGIAEVEVVAWHVQPGDAITEDQVLVELMTDKATVEIPSPVAGKVTSLGGEAGATLAVGAELIRIETGMGEVEEGGRRPPDEIPTVEATGGAASAPSLPTESARPQLAEPRLAEPAGSDHPIASPSVRRRAWELGLDLRTIPASGPGGRIMHADLDAAAGQGDAPAEFEGDPRYQRRVDETQVPIVGVRRVIAKRLQDTVQRIPHFTYVEEVDVTELEELRAALNEEHAPERGHLTLLPLLLRAIVLALLRFPQVNARFDDEAGIVVRHGAVHAGIATHTSAGLLVPVLRHAEALDPWTCASAIARLTDAARAGKATRDELTGSTITITSLGALGGVASTPVINSPEVAIVGVNRIVERPAVRHGAVAIRKLMNLSSSFDHRVVDGMDAAGFVQEIRARLERPARLFIE